MTFNPLLNNTEPNYRKVSKMNNDTLREQIGKIISQDGWVDNHEVDVKGETDEIMQLIADHDAQLYEELMAGEELVIDHGSNFNDMKQLWAVPLDHIKTVMKGARDDS